MLILHLFGHQRALEHWAMTQVHVSSKYPNRSLSVAYGIARITFVEALQGPVVEIHGIVVRDPFDLQKLAGLEPTVVIEHESFTELGGEVRQRLRAYVR